MTEIRLRTAVASDRDAIFGLLESAASWLRARGIDYWQNWLAPPAHHIRWVDDGLSAGEFRLIEGSDGVLGCVRLQDSDPLFWPDATDPAGYVHSLTIDRRLAGQGLGARVLDLIASELAVRGVSLLRLDCGESAAGLQHYYESLGFRPVGTTAVDGESLVLYERNGAERSLTSASS